MSCGSDGVPDVSRQQRAPDGELLQVDGLIESVEEPFAAAENHWCGRDHHLVDDSGRKRLSDELAATHDVDVLASCRLVPADDRGVQIGAKSKPASGAGWSWTRWGTTKSGVAPTGWCHPRRRRPRRCPARRRRLHTRPWTPRGIWRPHRRPSPRSALRHRSTGRRRPSSATALPPTPSWVRRPDRRGDACHDLAVCRVRSSVLLVWSGQP